MDVDTLKRCALARAPACVHPQRVWIVEAFPLAGTNSDDRSSNGDQRDGAAGREGGWVAAERRSERGGRALALSRAGIHRAPLSTTPAGRAAPGVPAARGSGYTRGPFADEASGLAEKAMAR
jgi:hypothetical protein